MHVSLRADRWRGSTIHVLMRSPDLQVYESLIPVYTSGVYSVCGGTRQFTVNVAGERQRRGLQLRGDILLKCYHRHYNPVPTDSPTNPTPPASDRPQRELIFACQFHTCAVTDYTLSFTRQELDSACGGEYPSQISLVAFKF